MTFKEKLMQAGLRAVSVVAQSQDHHNPVKTVTPGMPELLRCAAAQGAVLLENQVLPFAPGTKLSLFGRIQIDYFYTGYGSGGDVNYPYSVSLLEGLRSCEALEVNEELAGVYEAWVSKHPANHGVWGMWPRFHPEMPVSENLVAQARKVSDNAVIVLGRSAGEDRETTLEPGSFYLTQEEKQLLSQITKEFPQAVLVLNIPAVMDLGFLADYSFGAVLIPWQGGMESGNVVANLLCGKANPSGRLTDTIAKSYDRYPSAGHFGEKARNAYFEDIYVGYRYFETFAKEDVLYPFGHGLSYTTFSQEAKQTGPLTWQVQITNTGSRPGRETAMVFVAKPQGTLGNPARELAAFGKTKELQPGESQTLSLEADPSQLASYDDSGLTGHKNCYILLEGTYEFFCGSSLADSALAGTFHQAQTQVLMQCSEACPPAQSFPILVNSQGQKGQRMTPAGQRDLTQRILDHLPPAIPQTGNRGFLLSDVRDGKVSLDDFVAQLDLEELEAISRGAYIMGHPLGAKGNAGIFGGVTDSLREKGIPPVVTSDGPSGIRLYDSCSLLPIGTLLACSFDTGLVEDLYAHVGQEMQLRGSDVLLAPGLNIHRDPLCGRNFEYFSEDPYLTGRMAAAVVKGLQSQGVAACPKHFACNNQETNRTQTDSVLSQRALREIYLKGFEICVKTAAPKTLMTSYNKINGVWGHYHFDLVQTILRREWGFEGCILTDWWMRYAPSPEFPQLSGNAYRVRGGVNVLMPGSRGFNDRKRTPDGTLLATYGRDGGITLGELQDNAKHVLRCVLKLKLK